MKYNLMKLEFIKIKSMISNNTYIINEVHNNLISTNVYSIKLKTMSLYLDTLN